MSRLQRAHIKALKATIQNLKDRIVFNCWDCMGQQTYRKFDCELPQCSFYTIRPRTMLKKPQFCDLETNIEPVKGLSKYQTGAKSIKESAGKENGNGV